MAISVANYNKKYLRMTPQVKQIFNDLEEWKSYCQWKLHKYDPADLYRSEAYKKFERKKYYNKNHK